MKFQSTFSLASFTAIANAHTIFTQLQSGGTTYPISYGIRDPTYDGPINNVSTTDIACNGGPNPTTASPYVIDVVAGSTVQATWRHTLTATAANDPTYVIDSSHLGPVMAYMKKVTDATTDVGYGDGWFKISEAGFNPTTSVWAVTDLIAAAGIQNITIPKCIANGQYLLRAEIIALHSAGSEYGAQFYMECAQINVTGGTGASTPSTVALPGAYSNLDPGILINIYYPTVTSYTIPGPTAFTCGAAAATSTSSSSTKASSTATTLSTSTKSSSTSSSTKATTSSSSTKASTTSSSTKASSTTTSSAATSTGAALYGQCGGDPTTFFGPYTCAAGTCTYVNAYYSQCL